MCFSILVKDILMPVNLGSGICRPSLARRLPPCNTRGLRTWVKSISTKTTLALRSRARQALPLDLNIRALRIWGRSILTKLILALRYLASHRRRPAKLATRSRLAGKAPSHTRRLHLAGAASPLSPRGSAIGSSVFAGDVDHDC